MDAVENTRVLLMAGEEEGAEDDFLHQLDYRTV